jgi:hypothetical protein
MTWLATSTHASIAICSVRSDDALRLPVRTVTLDREVAVLGDLGHVLGKLRQPPAKQVAVNHGRSGRRGIAARRCAVPQERILVGDHSSALDDASEQG